MYVPSAYVLWGIGVFISELIFLSHIIQQIQHNIWLPSAVERIAFIDANLNI